MTGKESLTRLTGRLYGPNCDDEDCPNIYATQRNTFVVQGDAFTGFAAPDGECLVEIPENVLREAFRALGW
ncbi:hypothetical protein AB0D49_04650 [Streptomyces sp. NPDC048290]|uniref:hypothetical protein n=1 Tax=Streptomyces sp. NPDC048290 TaxID=3155811 RepID=UPI003444DA5E